MTNWTVKQLHFTTEQYYKHGKTQLKDILEKIFNVRSTHEESNSSMCQKLFLTDGIAKRNATGRVSRTCTDEIINKNHNIILYRITPKTSIYRGL